MQFFYVFTVQRIQISANLGEWILSQFANYFVLLLKAHTELNYFNFASKDD